jgi:transportin-3
MSAEELEIARITIQFWYLLTEEILKTPQLKSVFSPVYESLVRIVIKRMRYPADITTLTAEDRDEFRDFRHDIGDVLKDCVRVLGEEIALNIPYTLLTPFFNGNPTVCSKNWQEIEAPLFSLRTMCREISEQESKYIPEIMGMLPKLPDHPKVRYAAILVIGRYANWTNKHPELIAYQLDYVSKGFSGSEETKIAAAHAFRDLCKYCSKVIPLLN